MQTLACILGAMVGAIALPLATLALHTVFFPGLVREAQYTLVLILACVEGGLLGSLTGLVLALWLARKRRSAGWVATLGGGILAVLFVLLGWFVLAGTQDPSWGERAVSVFFWFGLPLAWVGALVNAGMRLLKRP